MKAVRKDRTVKVINPKEKGCQLISTKGQRNSPCQCGSKIKQKKCCGDDFQFRTTLPKNYVPEVVETETETPSAI